MSFFNDYVEDGLCCEQCGQFIGEGLGFVRSCQACHDGSAKTERAKPAPKQVSSGRYASHLPALHVTEDTTQTSFDKFIKKRTKHVDHPMIGPLLRGKGKCSHYVFLLDAEGVRIAMMLCYPEDTIHLEALVKRAGFARQPKRRTGV